MLESSRCGTTFYWLHWTSGAFALALFLSLLGGCDSSKKREVEVEKDKKSPPLAIQNDKKKGGQPEPVVKHEPKQRVKLWLIGAEKEHAVFEGPPPEKKESEAKPYSDKAIVAVAFSDDGKLLAVASEAGPVRLLDNNGKEQGKLIGTAPIAFAARKAILAFGAELALDLCLALSPDGKTLALAHDGIKLVDADTGKLLVHFKDVHKEPVRAVLFTADGKQLISAAGPELAFWDVAERKHLSTAPLPAHRTKDGSVSLTITPEPALLVITPDGKTLLSACPGFPLVTHCDATTGKDVHYKILRVVTSGPNGPSTFTTGFKALTFSADGKILAAAHNDGALRLWDAASGKLLALVPNEGKTVTPCAGAMAFSPDGSTLAVGCTDGSFQRWEVAKLLKQ